MLTVLATHAHISRVACYDTALAVSSLPPKQSRLHMAATPGTEAFSNHSALQRLLSRRYLYSQLCITCVH